MNYNPNGFPKITEIEDNAQQHIQDVIYEVEEECQNPDEYMEVDVTNKVTIVNKFPVKLHICIDDFNCKEFEATAALIQVEWRKEKMWARYDIQITKEF